MGTELLLNALAYDADSPVLLVLDRTELCAYDATTEAPRWQTKFDGAVLAAVLYCHPQALPPMGGTSPWRAAASERVAVVVDTNGHLHAVELGAGQRLGTFGPFGKPRAAAASIADQELAVAVDGKILLWHVGQLREIEVPRVSALAFSTDGKALVAGTDDGQIFSLALDGTSSAAESILRGVGRVTSVAAHPDGTWLVTTESTVFQVRSGVRIKLERLATSAERAAFDSTGKRLALQRSEQAIVVYSWPELSVQARVEYIERPIGGISFGAKNWLGVALDHGDGNKIDVVTSATHRTDTVPGRVHRSWNLRVDGQAQGEARRRQEATPPPPSGKGLKIGIGAGLSMLLIGLRFCLVLGRDSSSSYVPPLNFSQLPSVPSTCNIACEQKRLADVTADCKAEKNVACARNVEKVETALLANRCVEARAAMNAIDDLPRGSADRTLFDAHMVLARTGLSQSCGTAPRSVTERHAKLVKIIKGDVTTELVAAEDMEHGEQPLAVYTAPDGTIFVATHGDTSKKTMVYRRSPYGAWDKGFGVYAATHLSTSLFGRSSNDVYFTTGAHFVHFDGKRWIDGDSPNDDPITAAAIVGQDVFAAAWSATQPSAIYRKTRTTWEKEATPPDLDLLTVSSAGSSAWAMGARFDQDSLFIKRSADGWKEADPIEGALGVRAFWATPDGRDIFIGTAGSILHSADSGSTWTTANVKGGAQSIWGRSAKDVYAVDSSAVMHFDGKSWTPTDVVEDAKLLTGTKNELFVITYTP